MTAAPGTQRPSAYTPPPQAAARRSQRSGQLADFAVIARQSKELHALLRRRLLIVVAVAFAFFGILPIGSLVHMYDAGVPQGARNVLYIQLATALIIGVLGLVIWKRPPRRLPALRTYEMLIFGVGLAYMAISNAYFIHRYGLMTPPIEPARHPALNLSGTRLDPVSIRWLIFIIGYGTLVPNTWRRCATVVFSMVGTYLTALVTQAFLEGVGPGQLFSLLMYPVVWMMVTSVIAIYGSYRVHLLERRVQEAERLGQYKLKKHLGQGGMGEVYLAEHVLLKQPFAVKLLHPEKVADPRTLQRFEREVQAMARLEHWNTVEIYDYGHGPDGSFYYVMEYLPGLTLDELVKKHGVLPASRAIHFLRQICGALQEAHSMGVIHRDIKPGNIIVCERAGIYDVAKLLDFGLVKHFGITGDPQLTMEGTVAGTPAYMSPEQIEGSVHADARSDIYSLGAVAYFLLAGRPPFSNRSTMQLLAAHMNETAPPVSSIRPDISARLSDIVKKCLAKRPDDRFASADAVSAALSECDEWSGWSARDAENWWQSRMPAAATVQS